MSALTGKVALVTGGNGGIGLGMAEGLAQAGCDLVIWGSNAEKNAAAEKALKARGVRVLAQRCDVSDEAQVEARFAEALAAMGRIDGCFANAGVSQKHGPFHELATAEWKRVLGVNLDGAFYTFRAAARHMVERGGGGVDLIDLGEGDLFERDEVFAVPGHGKTGGKLGERRGVRAWRIRRGWCSKPAMRG